MTDSSRIKKVYVELVKQVVESEADNSEDSERVYENCRG